MPTLLKWKMTRNDMLIAYIGGVGFRSNRRTVFALMQQVLALICENAL
jgi:hypothetical protein